MKKLLLALVALGALAAFSTGCENAEKIIEDELDGEETALKEPDLKNCSRVINCCMKLAEADYDGIVPDAVREQCMTSIEPATNVVIDNYQTAKGSLDNLSDDAAREELQADLAEQAQAVEPGCRCFLDQTVGQISSTLLPKDCEFFEDSGALEPPATCDDATDALISAGSN